MSTYCGSKRPIPSGKVLGSPSTCFRSGLRSGFAAASQKAEQTATKAKTLSETKQKISKVLGAKKVIDDINTKGLIALKRGLHVSTMKADELRSLVARLHRGGVTYVGPTSHTNASKHDMIEWLVGKNWKR